MKAMILAAGQGTRMQPLTFDTPKPLIPFLGTPVMESIICHLESQGIKEIIINTSYLSEEIEHYFQSGQRQGVALAYSYEGYKDTKGLHSNALGSAGGISKIHHQSGFFDDSFIVLCGDALIDIDLQSAVAQHKKNGALATVILKQVDPVDVHKYGVVELANDDRIVSFQEKPCQSEAKSSLANVGIYIFEPEILDYIPQGQVFDIGGDLLPLLVEKEAPLYGYQTDFNWIDIGNLADYLKATQSALSNPNDFIPLPGSQHPKGLHCGINCVIKCAEDNIKGDVVIGSGCIIEEDVELVGPLLIGSNCVIESNTKLSKCIISDYCHIKKYARIHNKIIYKDYCIDQFGKYWSLSESKLDWLISDRRNTGSSHELRDLLSTQKRNINNVVYVNF
ncbi:MAG: mannose-1-phosphate guanyltransferase [Gammaproteobacteria bacterium]|nr:MAG: mannose-1-phosphate guanyltransferase [Gammaproteobacteria bacterium]PCJ19399.1 MAG: mannose-1-phosphate guanyltransferase [Gammaproteobacteria bacterium]